MPGRKTNSTDNVFMISLCVGLALLIVSVSGECDYPPEYQTAIMKDEHLTQGPPDFVEGFTINYKCQSGYVRKSGSPRITCTNSQWSNLTLVCDPPCGNPPIYPNAVLEGEPKGPFVDGFTISYTCQSGYVMKAGSPRITCTSSEWSHLTLVCERRSCGSPGEILNGRFNTDEGVLFGDKAYAVCDEGYQLAGNGVRNCLATGWDGDILRCEIVKCPDPTEIVNGEITNPPQRTVTFGTVIIYKCNKGVMVGNKELVCTKDGSYSSDPPACKEHNGCPSVQVKNGFKRAGYGPVYKYGDSITFACNPGYILHGTDTVTCGINEIWEPQLPTCQKAPTTTEVPPTPSPGFIYVIVGLLVAVAVAIAVAVGFWFFKKRKGSYFTAEKYEMKLAVNDEQQNMNSDLSLKKSSSSPRTDAAY